MTELLQTFDAFKNEIDQHYDRRERLIKISRDITALSKKMIFSLHRVPILPIQFGETAISANIAKEISKNETQIKELIGKASNDLKEANIWRYQRNISPAIQEFVEAITFRYYIQYQAVPTHIETQTLVGDIELTPADYILGIADLTGELARRAIAALAFSSPDALKYTTRISTCLTGLAIEFEGLDVTRNAEGLRELGKKISVMQSSVKKVEMGVFEKCIRGRERPEGWVSDMREERRED